jgi:tripartite-type tricarboxylate transporter receptor subunit TctC
MLRGLAITSRKQLPELPDVPTADESGLPGFEANGWSALFAPAGTPPDIVDKIDKGVNEFLESDAGRQQLARIWMAPVGGTSKQLADYLKNENAKWGPIIKETGLSLQ